VKIDVRILIATFIEGSQTLPTIQAENAIRNWFLDRLSKYEIQCLSYSKTTPSRIRSFGPTIRLTNEVDKSSPPLEFIWSDSYKICEGVTASDPDSQVGCGQEVVDGESCRPNMGIGCEHSHVCECLEYADVDQIEPKAKRISAPKPFPYDQMTGLLTRSYLQSRHPIYECNDKCRCGENCRSKLVQYGRQVPLEIFMTKDGRGWGLKCMVKLRKGQFIDCYFGEIITDGEALAREDTTGRSKNSYLFNLDKFKDMIEDAQLENEMEMYVVDGELWGGPARFINHSCKPNCSQYAVSFNKNDHRLYHLGFFTNRNISAREELTLDYLDLDDDKEEDWEPVTDMSIPCLCKSRNCRKWLWR
jgi:histone-lysine N-methyltransferase SUV39H